MTKKEPCIEITLPEFREEMLKRFDALDTKLDRVAGAHEERLRNLETWRDKALGMIAVVSLAVSGMVTFVIDLMVKSK